MILIHTGLENISYNNLFIKLIFKKVQKENFMNDQQVF